MKSVYEIKNEIDRLVAYYTSKEFAKCITAERGYHLVRAFDQLVGEGWFYPYKPVINYRAMGPDQIKIDILEFHPMTYSITITKEQCRDD